MRNWWNASYPYLVTSANGDVNLNVLDDEDDEDLSFLWVEVPVDKDGNALDRGEPPSSRQRRSRGQPTYVKLRSCMP